MCATAKVETAALGGAPKNCTAVSSTDRIQPVTIEPLCNWTCGTKELLRREGASFTSVNAA